MSRNERFGEVREKLRLATTGPELGLALGDATVMVETPLSPTIDSLKTLVVVDVGVNAVETATSLLAGADTVVLIRADDSVDIGRIIDAIDAFRRAGAQHIVLGVTRPAAPLTNWDRCPFPPASDAARVDDGMVTLRVERDERNRVRVVHVEASSGYGFGGAAALCIARGLLPPAGGANGKPFRVHFSR